MAQVKTNTGSWTKAQISQLAKASGAGSAQTSKAMTYASDYSAPTSKTPETPTKGQGIDAGLDAASSVFGSPEGKSLLST